MQKNIRLSLGNQTVKIEAGELVGFEVAGHEFIHQKGSPGWRNSDTEMFPIIGPTDQADFRIQTPKGVAIQDQHGLLREMKYRLTEQTVTSAVFKKRYKANNEVKNSKYPDKSFESDLSWPYNFEFTKAFVLSDDGLKVSFIVEGEKDMPFMLGYHPAFKVHTTNASIKTSMKSISIAEVMAVGSRALHISNCEQIVLSDSQSVEISTTGFGDYMLWTEVPNMVCIEPITFYPYAVAQANLHEGFTHLTSDKEEYEVRIKPFKN